MNGLRPALRKMDRRSVPHDAGLTIDKSSCSTFRAYDFGKGAWQAGHDFSEQKLL